MWNEFWRMELEKEEAQAEDQPGSAVSVGTVRPETCSPTHGRPSERSSAGIPSSCPTEGSPLGFLASGCARQTVLASPPLSEVSLGSSRCLCTFRSRLKWHLLREAFLDHPVEYCAPLAAPTCSPASFFSMLLTFILLRVLLIPVVHCLSHAPLECTLHEDGSLLSSLLYSQYCT